MTGRRWVAVFVVVAVAGTLGDRYFHHALGVLHYVTPHQPWWVLGIMGTSGVFAVAAVQRIHRVSPWTRSPPSGLDVVGDVGVLVLAYAATGVFASSIGSVVVGLGIAWVARVVGREGRSVVHALAAAVVGPAVEAALIAAGIFRYDDALIGVMSVPMWLPALYLHVGIAGESVGRWLGARRA